MSGHANRRQNWAISLKLWAISNDDEVDFAVELEEEEEEEESILSFSTKTSIRWRSLRMTINHFFTATAKKRKTDWFLDSIDDWKQETQKTSSEEKDFLPLVHVDFVFG